MPAVNVARTDTFEQQRVKINEISTQIFTVTAGGSDLSTGNLKLGDGLVSAPSLAFVNDVSLGIYRNGTGVLGFASAGKKLSDLAAASVKYYRDFVIEKNSLDTLGISITNVGSNYDGGTYTSIPAIGGTGDGATVGVTIDGFGGSITQTGSGYTPGVYLNIPVISSGSGTGATIDFTVDQISGQITNGGINYYPGSYTNLNVTGGNGVQMTADVVVSAFAATVTSGSNYPSGIWKSIPLTGGNGTGMLVNLNVQNGGVQPFGGVDSSEFVSVTSNYTVGDVLTGGIPQVGTQTFTVKSSLGNKYFIDGFLGGDFNLLKGKTYVFNLDDTTNNQHPMFISTVDADTNTILDAADGVTYELDGSTVTGAGFLAGYFAATSRIITFAVPTNPNNLVVYYGCSVHPNQGGSLTLTDFNSQQSGFQLVVDTIGGTVSEFIVNAPGDGNYQVGDVISIAAADLYDVNGADAATLGSGLQITLGGNFGAIAALDQISAFGSGYTTGEILTLATAVNNVSTYARGELQFLGVTFNSNAGVTAVQYSGIAAGGANTYNNIAVQNISSSGSGLRVNVEVIFAGGNNSYNAVTIVAAGQGYLPGDTLYIPGNQLGGAAGAQPGSGGNDLAISVDTIEAGSPQVTVASTTGIEVGDGVELIQNINNTAQIPANVTVASVDSATQFTMSAGPTQPGQADIKVVNQNQTYLTVASTTGIVAGMIVVKQSGNGEIIAGSTVTQVVDATTVEISILPTLAGDLVVNFEPEYGGGSGFQYTVGTLGFASEVTIVDGGNGYTVGDILNVSAFDLVQPEVYAVTNLEVDKIVFTSTTLPANTFSVGDLVRDAGGGIVASTVTVSTTVGGGANANYTAVAPSGTSGNGAGATFDVTRGVNGEVLSVVVTTGSEGYFYAANDTITIPGASIGGSTPADNVTLSVTNVTSAGTPVKIQKVKLNNSNNISYIVIDTFGFQDGFTLVKDSAPSVAYNINTAVTEYRYFIDLNDGNGAVMTPSWTVYAGNSYTFDLSDNTNGSHVFALSQFPDGRWAPSRVENVSTTLSASSPTITVPSTTGIQAGFAVEKVSGDGIIPSGTTVLTVVNGTTLTLSANPTTAGAVVFNFFGATYTTGVTVDGTNHTIKIADDTPNLYYFCATENADHVNEGGDDGDEALMTVSTNNPKTFGSGLEITVTDVVVEEVVKGKVDDGEFTVQKLVTPEADIVAAAIANATVSATANLKATVTSSITAVANENLSLAVTDPLTNNLVVDAAGLNVGSTIQIAATSGNITGTGELKGASVSVGDYLKLLSSNNSLSSLGGYDVIVAPDTGRIADVLTNTAIAIPVGTTAERPTAGIVKDGCIRYNTDTNQYEGYSTNSTSWSSLGGVRDLDGNTTILAEETVGANDNTLWFINDNINTIRVTPNHLEFVNMKKMRSVNVSAPAYVEWNANTPVTVGQYLKYKNNLYEVTQAGTTATSGAEPVHTSGALQNGSAELTYSQLAVAPLTFEDIEELRIGPLGGLPLSINGDLRLFDNVINTDVSDLLLRPNSGKRVIVDATTSLVVPNGTTAERGTAEQGSIRYNTTTLTYEGYDGTNWGSLGGVKDVDQNTYIIPETTPGANENVLYFYNDGSNTMQLTTTALDFYSVDTIRSQTSQQFEITANLMTFNNAETTFDNTNALSTFLHTSKQYFDLGVSTGVYVDPILRLDDQGDVYLNTGFGTGNYNGVKVFDGDLKEFELADVKILSETITLTKGSSNNGGSNIYPVATAKGAKVVVVAENLQDGEKEFIEFGVTDDGTDVFHTEYGNLRTDYQLIVPSFEFTAGNEARLNILLGANVPATNSVKITFSSTITKK